MSAVGPTVGGTAVAVAAAGTFLGVTDTVGRAGSVGWQASRAANPTSVRKWVIRVIFCSFYTPRHLSARRAAFRIGLFFAKSA
jgi:hypothetical protein